MKKTKTIFRDNGMQQFHIQMWDVSQKKLVARGHIFGPYALTKRWVKHYWEGRIEHLQTGDFILFRDVGMMLSFIMKHRL